MKKERPQEREREKRRPPAEPASRAWFMILVLSFCVGLMIYVDFNRRLWNAPPEEPIPGRHWGNPEGELKIQQFLDFQSPEAQRGEIAIHRFMQKHPTEVFLQTRYFPQDDNSVLIDSYAECANRQKKFRVFTALLYEKYYQWSGLSGVSPILKTVAHDVGCDMEQLKGCVDSRDVLDVITKDRVYAESLFVRSTPSYFLNDTMVVGVEGLQKALEEWDVTLIQDE